MTLIIKNKIQFSIFLFINTLLIYYLMETQAQAADTSLVSQIVSDFKSLTDQWMKTAIKYAKIIFYWCLVLEIAYLGIKGALGKAEIGEILKNFIMAVLTAAFFWL